MLWIYLIILIVLLFGGLLFFLQYVLTRNIRKATNRLHELSKDYAAKEEEANQLLQNAQREAKSIVAKETHAAEEAKNKLIKEGQDQKAQILKEANQKSAEITEKAQRNADFLRKEIENKINESAKEMINGLIHKVIPNDILNDVHQRWLSSSDEGAINFKHLKLPEDMKEATVVSAFELSAEQKEGLKKQLKKKIGPNVNLKYEKDPSLLAGFIIRVGSVVVDASLKYKVQKAMQE